MSMDYQFALSPTTNERGNGVLHVSYIIETDDLKLIEKIKNLSLTIRDVLREAA